MRTTGAVIAAIVLSGGLCVVGGEAPTPRPKAPLLRQAGPPPEMAQLKAALAKKVTFDFAETPLRDVLTFLSQLLGINIVLDPALDPDRPVTLRVNDMAGGHALGWVARLVGGQMRVENGAVFIAPPPRPKGPGGESRLLGKAQLGLGKLGTVELYLYEDTLDPDLRHLLMETLRAYLAGQLREIERRLEAQEREQERFRRREEPPPRRPPERRGEKGGEF